MNVVMQMGSVIATTAIALALTLGQANAQNTLNTQLNGNYVFTQSRDCINTSDGFAENFSLNPISMGGFLNRVVNTDRGMIHYNGNGTGTATGVSTGININVGPGGFPVGQSQFTCNLTYDVHPDGSVDQQATCSSTTTSGTTTITGIHTRRQLVQGNAAILHGSAEPPVIETGTVTPSGGGPSSTFYRVCVRSGISYKFSTPRP